MLELNLEFARVAVALIAVGFAAYEDWKTSFINNRLMYTMIAGGVLLNLLSGNWNLIAFALGGAALIFGIGWFLYKTGQLGGGDVLLFTGLHLLVPVIPIQTILAIQQLLGIQEFFAVPAQATAILGLPFIFSVIVASSVLAMMHTSAAYGKTLLFSRGFVPKPDFLLAAPFLLFAGVFFFYAAPIIKFSQIQIAAFSSIFIAGAFLAAFKRQIEDEVIIKEISIKEIEDEDVLALDKMDEKIVKEYGLEKVLTTEQVEKLKKIEKEKCLHKFPVLKVLPRFGPFVLWGLAACLVFGDLLVAIMLPSI